MGFTGEGVIAIEFIAVVIIYLLHPVVSHVSVIDTVRGIAIIGLVGGFLSRLIGGREAFRPRRPATGGASATLGLGVLAMITGSDAGLAIFIAANVLLSAAAMNAQSLLTWAH